MKNAAQTMAGVPDLADVPKPQSSAGRARRIGDETLRLPLEAIAAADARALHHRPAQQALATAAGDRNRAGVVEEDQQLIAGTIDLGLQITRHTAAPRRGRDGAELATQAPPALGRER